MSNSQRPESEEPVAQREETADTTEETKVTEIVEEELKAEEEPSVEQDKEEEEEEEEKEEIVEEKIYTIPLGRAWIYPRPERTPKSVKLIRKFILRHMKSEEIKIQRDLNSKLWSRSIEKPPRRVRVRAAKNKEGIVKVSLFKGQSPS